ncbi:MAG TPA: WecB/TagA/CpsF family glycosyltransferase [Rickettsiales bacterium]|nr:WecB/TagA/CpsF family glycosyltransferase [Rickettsiales bacterium]
MIDAATYLENPTHRITFMSTPMDAITMEETIAIAERAMVTRKRLQHVVVNVAKLVNMQTNKALYEDVCASDLINIDGMGVVWGARLCGHKVPERVSGVDIMENLLKLCEAKGFRPYFFGAKQEVLEQAVANIKQQYPKLQIAGYRNGYFTPQEEESIIRDIAASNADCLFIAITSPTKERLLAQYKDIINVPFLMGVGGSIDVKAGFVKRAPVWMQRIGLEWFYRLAQEPKRMFRRYWNTNVSYAFMLFKEWQKA